MPQLGPIKQGLRIRIGRRAKMLLRSAPSLFNPFYPYPRAHIDNQKLFFENGAKQEAQAAIEANDQTIETRKCQKLMEKPDNE